MTLRRRALLGASLGLGLGTGPGLAQVAAAPGPSDSAPAARGTEEPLVFGLITPRGSDKVLAAWNGLSASIDSSVRPSSVRNATATSAPLAAMAVRRSVSSVDEPDGESCRPAPWPPVPGP